MIKIFKCWIFGHEWEEMMPRDIVTLRDLIGGAKYTETRVLFHCNKCSKIKIRVFKGEFPAPRINPEISQLLVPKGTSL